MAGLIVAACTTSAYSTEVASPSGSALSPADALRVAISDVQSGNTQGALTVLNTTVHAPDFNTIPSNQRFYILFIKACAEEDAHQSDAAYADIVSAGQADPTLRPPPYQGMLLQTAIESGHVAAAADALNASLLAAPSQAGKIPTQLITEVLDGTQKLGDGGAQRAQLLQTLWHVRYQPADPSDLDTPQFYWTWLVESDVDRGQIDQAREVLAAIKNPYRILELRADQRYRPLVAADPSRMDADLVNQQYLAFLQAQVASYPRLLSVLVSEAQGLIEVNRLQDALQLLREAQDKIAHAAANAPAYDDIADSQRWVLDTQARVLARLGRWDDVLAAQTAARDDAQAKQGDVVSQKINLGDLLNRLGRPQDALNELQSLDLNAASPYGTIEANEVRSCAYAQLGDHAQAGTILASMLAQGDLDPQAVRDTQLCVGDEDGLARHIVEQLNNPATRVAELALDQHYLPHQQPTGLDRDMEARLNRVLARPEVQTAIHRVGFIESYPLATPDH